MELGLSELEALDIASEIYADKFGHDKLIGLLKDIYFTSEVQPEHKDVASIPWCRVYTTNYDEVFEIAARNVKKQITSLTLTDSVRDYLDRDNFCLHINGLITRLTCDSLFGEFKLTSSSYLTSDFNKSKWSSVFRQDINLAKSIIFIGYSVYDINIARILYDTEAIKDKCVFVVGDTPSTAEQYKIKAVGRLVVGGTTKFVAAYKEIEKAHIKKEGNLIFKSFEELTVVSPAKQPTDDDRYNMLLRGELSRDLIFSSIGNSTSPYIIDRQVVVNARTSIEKEIKYIVINGDLGNGKTVIVEELACASIQRGMRVFALTGHPKYALEDFHKLIQSREKCVLIIENYSRHIDFIKNIGMRNIPGHVYILTERSALHEYYIEELSLPADEYIEFDCNKLSNSEIEGVIRLLSTSGLWGEKTSLSDSMKRKLIKEDLHSEFQAILIDILNSPVVKNKLISVFEGITPGSNTHKIILLAFVLKFIDYSSTTLVVSELLGIDSVHSALKSKEKQLKEVLSIVKGDVIVKSSILAKFFLSHLETGALPS